MSLPPPLLDSWILLAVPGHQTTLSTSAVSQVCDYMGKTFLSGQE